MKHASRYERAVTAMRALNAIMAWAVLVAGVALLAWLSDG